MYMHAYVYMYVITCIRMYALACKYVQAVSRSRPHSTLRTVIALTYVRTYVHTYICVCSLVYMQQWKEYCMISDDVHTYVCTMYLRTYVHTSLNMWLTGVVMNCAGVSGWA